MSDESQHDIFEPRLNERGIRYIMKFVSIVKIVILTGVISSLLLFITSLGRIFNDTIDYSNLIPGKLLSIDHILILPSF